MEGVEEAEGVTELECGDVGLREAVGGDLVGDAAGSAFDFDAEELPLGGLVGLVAAAAGVDGYVYDLAGIGDTGVGEVGAADLIGEGVAPVVVGGVSVGSARLVR